MLASGPQRAHAMNELKGKVAVITGAASGFGRELAILCAAEGMHVVLADVVDAGLQDTEALLAAGTQSLRVVCDVRKPEAVEALAAATYERFGAAHVLFNNAGVAVTGPMWTATLDDWRWVLDVNLMGVVHGIKSFVPRMLAAGTQAHIVNTSSVAGLLSVPGSSVYCASKHAVVTVSECLYHELQMAGAPIGVSVLCPAFVKTGIADSHRVRPADLADTNPHAASYAKHVKQALEAGKLSATDVAVMTMDAVKKGQFYIFTHPKYVAAAEVRVRNMLELKQPVNPMPRIDGE